MKYTFLYIAIISCLTKVYSQANTNLQEQVTKSISKAFKQKAVKPISDYLLSGNLNDYWVTYLNYNKSLINVELGNKKEAKSFFNSGFKKLRKQNDVESYILMALIENASIKVVSPHLVPYKSESVKTYLQKAKLLEMNNPRIYLIEGIHDFYTPKIYGGLIKTEALLMKAIRLFNTNNSSEVRWGEDLCYLFLLKYYKKINNQEKKLLQNLLF